MCIYTYNIASCVHNLDVIDAYIHTDGNTDTQRLRSSSFLGLPYRILYMNPPKRNYYGGLRFRVLGLGFRIVGPFWEYLTGFYI